MFLSLKGKKNINKLMKIVIVDEETMFVVKETMMQLRN